MRSIFMGPRPAGPGAEQQPPAAGPRRPAALSLLLSSLVVVLLLSSSPSGCQVAAANAATAAASPPAAEGRSRIRGQSPPAPMRIPLRRADEKEGLVSIPLLLRARGGASSTAKGHPALQHGKGVSSKKHHDGKAVSGKAEDRKGPSAAGAQEEFPPPAQLTLKSAPASLHWLNGVFTRTDWDHNGRAHYEKALSNDEMAAAMEASSSSEEKRVVHLYWHSAQWVLHYDLDPALNYDHYLGYCKLNSADVGRTDKAWLLRERKKWVPAPAFRVHVPGRSYPQADEEQAKKAAAAALAAVPMPPRLLPVYLAFFLDAIGTGLASPILPFYIMSLGANAFQLGLVLAFNYLAQTVGCIVMGNVSDKYGRRPVMLCCLAASFVSLSVVSRARTLPQVAIGRVIGGMCGGFVPLAQSAVADQCPMEVRAKFLGRIQACMGAGFVAGPALSLLGSRVYGLDTRGILKRAAALPALAFLYASVFLKETKDSLVIVAPATGDGAGGGKPGAGSSKVTIDINSSSSSKEAADGSAKKGSWALPPLPVRLLVLNGFLLMYAFSVETVYAMFIKDNFGYEETALGLVFALNGIAVGLLQVFLIKNLFARLGKHVMLALGNLLLATGMVGLSLLRYQVWHFAMFSVHIIGYAISDTALASLISRYSSPDSQGKNLGWSHAAQSCARIISPLIAGTLYEMSKAPDHPLPPGALPYIAGSAMPLLGVMVPTILYLRSIEAKRAKLTGEAPDR